MKPNLLDVRGQITPGPWVACYGDDHPRLRRDDSAAYAGGFGGKRLYFPHVHLGPDDHDATWQSATGETYRRSPHYLIINSVTRGGGGADMPEFDADARAIGAVPELLDLLKVANELCDRLHDDSRWLLVEDLAEAVGRVLDK